MEIILLIASSKNKKPDRKKPIGPKNNASHLPPEQSHPEDFLLLNLTAGMLGKSSSGPSPTPPPQLVFLGPSAQVRFRTII
jgi:hypothetical protein